MKWDLGTPPAGHFLKWDLDPYLLGSLSHEAGSRHLSAGSPMKRGLYKAPTNSYHPVARIEPPGPEILRSSYFFLVRKGGEGEERARKTVLGRDRAKTMLVRESHDPQSIH